MASDIVSQVVSAVSWPTLVLIAWRISDTLSTLKEQMHAVMTNHLPHIYDELIRLRKELNK